MAIAYRRLNITERHFADSGSSKWRIVTCDADGMSRAEQFVELWNSGRVEDALGETTPEYTYTDPVMGGPHDREAHIALMKQIYEAMPDRRIRVERLWVADGAEFLEYTWSGTRPDGERIENRYLGILEFDHDGRAARQRHLAI